MQLAGYDVDHHFIRRIENGQRFVTDIELVALSETLSVSIYDLVDSSIPICNPSDWLHFYYTLYAGQTVVCLKSVYNYCEKTADMIIYISAVLFALFNFKMYAN